MKKKTLVVIDREKWSRGNLADNALLVNREVVASAKFQGTASPLPKIGTMCCLGFACRAMGASVAKIRGERLPAGTGKLMPGLTEDRYGYIQNTEFSEAAAEINDSYVITDREREKQLKALASENGFTFKFIN